MKKYIIIVLVLFLIVSTKDATAGDGGYITVVNSTPYNWERTLYNSDGENGHWTFPERIKAGTSVNVYVEFDYGNTFREVRYRISGAKYDDYIHIYLKTKKYGKTINVLYKLDAQNVKSDKRYDLGFEHDGIVSLIIVGDHSNFLCNSAEWAMDWMHRFLPWIGDIPLHQLVITGSHDAGMGLVGHTTLFVDDCAVRTQNHLIGKQLQYGTRYFDIRPLLRDGQYNTGHYSKVGDTHIGGDGQSIKSIIDDINNFTAGSRKELIILDVSHDLNIETDESFTHDEWDALIDQLSGINFLYDGPRYDPKNLTLNDLIKETSQVMILVDGSHLPAVFLPAGFIPSYVFDIYTDFANTNDFGTMKHDQFQKMQNHSWDNYFLLSWILTQSLWQQGNCSANIVGASSIVDLGKFANQNLPGSLFNKTSFLKYPNIILIDAIDDNNSALMAMAINYRNMLDLQSARVPPLIPDHTFYHPVAQSLPLKSTITENFPQLPYSKKELFYNYEQKDLCFQVNDNENKIQIFTGFMTSGYFSKLYNGLIDIDMDQNSDGKSYLSFCTSYKGHLTVGWHVEQKTLPHLGLATVAPTNFPYEQFNHAMYTKVDSKYLRGAYEQVENSDTLLCFVYDTQIIRARISTDLSSFYIKDTKDFSTEDYLNIYPKIRQVLSYKQDGETRLLFVVKSFIPDNNPSGFSYKNNLYIYQYLPKTNELQKIYDFGNKRDVFLIEGAIDKIFNKSENEGNTHISHRFQAFVFGNKKVPHTKSYMSYIYTFGVRPGETILMNQPLSIYFLDPPSNIFFIGEGEKNIPLNASYKYVPNANGGTDRETWLWYATNRKALTAQIFKGADMDDGVMKGSFIRRNIDDINWNIYPNPTTNGSKFVVEYEITKPSTVNLELYSIQGVLIKQMKVQQKYVGDYEFEICISGLSHGTYLLVIRINDYADSKIVYIN